jgi:hypothetical protein
MRALVVYESMFGNTEEIARSVAKGISRHIGRYIAVDLVEVGTAPSVPPDDVDLLIVGAPTHAFGLSRPGTRRTAAQQAGTSLVSRGDGLREWLDRLAPPIHPVSAAAFDTRFAKPRWLTGSAAIGAARVLWGHGYHLVVDPESFFVTSTSGPIAEGEQARAQEWGATVGAAALERVPHR